MRKILLALLAFSASASTIRQEQDLRAPEAQRFLNGGGENGLLGWEKNAGGGTLDISNSGCSQGEFCIAWNPSGSTQFVSATIKMLEGDGATGCRVAFKYKGGGGLVPTITIGVYDSTVTNLKSQLVTITSAAASWTPLEIPFDCSDAQTAATDYKLFMQAAGNADQILIDEGYAANDWNVGTLQQARFLGSLAWQGTSSCNWTNSTTSFANLTDADCDDNPRTATGLASDPTAGQRPAIGIPYRGPGRYVLVAHGLFYKTSGASTEAYFRVSDGTNTWETSGGVGSNLSTSGTVFVPSISGEFTYTGSAPSSTLTLDIQAKINNTSSTSGIDSTQTSGPLIISVYYYPSNDQTIQRADAPGNLWTSYTPTGSWTNATYTGQYQCVGANTLAVSGKATLTGTPGAANFTTSIPSSFTIDTTKLPYSSAGYGAILGAGTMQDASTSQGYTFYPVYNSTSGVLWAFQASTAALGSPLTITSPITVASGDVVSWWFQVPVTSGCGQVPGALIPGSGYWGRYGIVKKGSFTFTCSSSSSIAAANNPDSLVSGTPGNISSGNCTVSFAAGYFSSVNGCSVNRVASNNSYATGSSITTSGMTVTISASGGGDDTSGDVFVECTGAP